MAKATLCIRVDERVRAAVHAAASENGTTPSAYAAGILHEHLRDELPEQAPTEPSAAARRVGRLNPLAVIDKIEKAITRDERLTLLEGLALSAAYHYSDKRELREVLAGLAEGLARGDAEARERARSAVHEAMFSGCAFE